MSSTAGDFGSNGWNIDEEDSYVESVVECGGYAEVDDAIAWVDFFLNRNPLHFKKLRPNSDIRILKTKLRIKGTRVYPAYRLLFSVNESTRTVTKLHIAPSEPDDMIFGDPWDEYDDPIPF
jgi:hypothetical protein